MSAKISISNSEVSTYLVCERKHFYAHIKCLEPVRFNTALTRGIIGHEALSVFYKAKMDGISFNIAVVEALAKIDEFAIQPGADLEMLGKLRTLISNYLDWSQDTFAQWEILAVEQVYHLGMREAYDYSMRLDVLARILTGRFAGEIAVIDHKFVYDFKTDAILGINSQLPKYIATVRANGIPVTHGIINQLRHREQKDKSPEKYFKRMTMVPSTKRIRNIMAGQIAISDRIIARRSVPVEVAHSQAVPVLNDFVCKYCDFINMCTADIEGENVSVMEQVDFRPNSYGYTPDMEVIV